MPIASTSTPMCSRLEYASRRFHGSGFQRNGTATASEARPNATNSPRTVSAPTAGVRAAPRRHATSATVGRSAADRRALTGGGASLWASGSQLWTGAQPPLVASPASISTYAATTAAPDRPGAAAAMRSQPRSAAAPGREAICTLSITMPKSANASPRLVRTRYFHPASTALALPLKAISSAEAAVEASRRIHARPEAVGQGHRDEHRPEGEHHRPVEPPRRERPRARGGRRAQVRGRDGAGDRAHHRGGGEEHRAAAVDAPPRAGERRLAGPRHGRGGDRQRGPGGRDAAGAADPVDPGGRAPQQRGQAHEQGEGHREGHEPAGGVSHGRSAWPPCRWSRTRAGSAPGTRRPPRSAAPGRTPRRAPPPAAGLRGPRLRRPRRRCR